jgi:pyrimidine 5'-nucleotidase
MTVAGAAPPARRAPPRALLVDLDDCLYEAPALSALVADNIRAYMVAELGFEADEVEEQCRHLYLTYGTTLAGLVAAGHTIDYDDWHARVHGALPYEEHLRRDPKLKAVLNAIDTPKWVFTNADTVHAEKCLALLGIRDCFRGVICFESVMAAAAAAGVAHRGVPVVCKPQREAFALALAAAGAEAASTAFFDDSARNIASAHRMGIRAVLVGRTEVDVPCDLQVHSLLDLPATAPWLFPVGDGRPAEPLALEGAAAAVEELLEEAQGREPVRVAA